mgnify:CR=1 FL=1
MGYVYFILGAHSQSKKQYKEAILYLNKAKEMFLDNFPLEIHPLGSRFAECYLALKEFDKAESTAKENLKIKNLNDSEKIYNYKVLEKIYQKKGLNSELLRIKDSLILISSGSSAPRIFKTLNNLETQIQLANSAKELNESKIFNHQVPSTHNSFIYLIEGEIEIGNNKHESVKDSTLILLSKGENLKVTALTNAKFLLISGKPIGEQIARGGPFVMNTKQEILQAIDDYHNGNFVK